MEVGVLLNNAHSEISLANPKALELLGLTDDQIKGKTPFDQDWHAIHEDGTPFPAETHPAAQVIATGEPVFRQRLWRLKQPNHNNKPDEHRRFVSMSICFVFIAQSKNAG